MSTGINGARLAHRVSCEDGDLSFLLYFRNSACYNTTKESVRSDWLIQHLLFAHGCMLLMYSITKVKHAFSM